MRRQRTTPSLRNRLGLTLDLALEVWLSALVSEGRPASKNLQFIIARSHQPLSLHHLNHYTRRTAAEDLVTPVYCLDMWRAHAQRRRGECR